MARRSVAEVEWWSFYAPDGHEWPLVFTAPGLCKYWDGSWVGLTVFGERKIYIDPRPRSHGKDGFVETALHEIMHVVRGPDVDLRRDEPFIRRVSPALNRILRPVMPKIPSGLEPLRRRAYAFDAAKRRAEEEFWS